MGGHFGGLLLTRDETHLMLYFGVALPALLLALCFQAQILYRFTNLIGNCPIEFYVSPICPLLALCPPILQFHHHHRQAIG